MARARTELWSYSHRLDTQYVDFKLRDDFTMENVREVIWTTPKKPKKRTYDQLIVKVFFGRGAVSEVDISLVDPVRAGDSFVSLPGYFTVRPK